MDPSTNSEDAIKIFSIITFSFGFCCLILCCGGYILSKKNAQRTQIHFTNHQYSSEAHAHIFTIEVPDTQSSNTAITDSSYLHSSDKPPPSYESIEEQTPLQHESNIQISQVSTTEQTS